MYVEAGLCQRCNSSPFNAMASSSSWLESTLLRLASAEDGAALAGCLDTYLVPIIQRLECEESRTKVMEILVHVNKRVKNDLTVSLPVQKLVQLYTDSTSSFVVNFAFVYIKLGFPRLALEEQERLVPQLVQLLNTKPSAQVDVLLHLILPALPNRREKRKEEKDLEEKQKRSDDKVFIDFLLDVLLLGYGVSPPTPTTSSQSAPSSDSSTVVQAAPGLSMSRWRRAVGPSALASSSSTLEKLKVRIVNYLEHYDDTQSIAMHLLVASADTRHSVATLAESSLRRLANRMDWEDPKLIEKLYSLFLGSSEVSKADTRLRLKLLTKLSSSRKAASVFPSSVQVVFDLFFGKTANARLKVAGVTFVHHVIDNCMDTQMETVGRMIMQALGKLVRDEEEEGRLRASCYLAIGKLGRRVPRLVNGDVLLLQMFFDAMAKEDRDTQLSVQEAMAMMANAFMHMSEDKLMMLDQLLIKHIDNQDEPHVRRMAVHYASEVFDATHLSSRFILIQGSGDKRQEIAADAQRALYKKNEMPDFQNMLEFVVHKIEDKSNKVTDSEDKNLPLEANVCRQLCLYMRRCLLQSAIVSGDKANEMEVDNSNDGANRDDEDKCDQDEPWYKACEVRAYLKSVSSSSPSALKTWASFTLRFFLATQDLEAACCILQLTGCSSHVARALINMDGISRIRRVLDSSKEDIRQHAAHLYGLLVANMITIINNSGKDVDAVFQSEVQVNLRTIDLHEKGGNVERLNGFITALGHVLSEVKVASDEVWQKLVCDRLVSPLSQCRLMHALTMEALMWSLGEVGRHRQINFGPSNQVKGMIETLFEVVEDAKVGGKIREKAALASARLCVGGSLSIQERREVIERVLKVVKEVRDVELQLTLGEALTLAALGDRSKERRDKWGRDLEEERRKVTEKTTTELLTEEEDVLFSWLLDTLCANISNTHPVARQSSVLWLLTLVKQGYKLSSLKTRLEQVQHAFMSVLGDNSDLVQDAACKGLSLVYEGCNDESKRDDLLSQLVRTLTEGSMTTRKVEGDTQIFNEGQLGKTPGGGAITTYKELCSLASELNQPELIYKFMHLANHNSAWNSRRGAAFGFSAIAAKAGEQLTQKLSNIVPKLYRYQFDPQPRVQQAMASIWSALIVEPNVTIASNSDAIIREIESNLTHAQWRVREACCGAIVDLLRHHGVADAHVVELMHLYRDLFRLMDDIKESVRVAAAKSAQSMANFSVRVCDQSGKAEHVGSVLKPLIEDGVSSTVMEVKQLAVATLIKITKSVVGGSEGSRSLLRRHVHVLVPALLTAVGESESETQINYLSVRLNNDPEVQEKLDLMRIASAKTSSAMECTLAILPLTTPDELAALVPGLVDLIKGNVGIVTKGAVAHFVTILSQRLSSDLQPHAGKLLAAFVAGLTGRVVAVRKTYAATIGHLMKASKDSSMTKLCAKLRTWYIEDDQTTNSEAIALTLTAINSHNPDRMHSHAAMALPIVFLGMHETSKEDNMWSELWSEAVSTSTMAIRTHLEPMLDLIKEALSSTQWRLKAQAARAVSTIVSTLKQTTPETDTVVLYQLLHKALGGRTWDGKEDVMRAFSQICCCTNIKRLLKDDELEDLKEALLRECKKRNIDYKLIAVTCTAEVDESMGLNMFKELFELVFPVLSVGDSEDGSKDMSKTDMDHDLRLRLESKAYACLAKSWRPNSLDSELKRSLFEAMLDRSTATTRRNQLEMANAIKTMLNKWSNLKEEMDEVVVPICRTLAHLLSMPKSKQLRLTALGAVAMLLDKWKEEMVLDELGKSVNDVVRDVSGDPETKAVAREIKKRLNDIEKRILEDHNMDQEDGQLEN